MASDSASAGPGGQAAGAPVRRTLTPAQAYETGFALHRQGRLGEAEQVYRALLRLAPDHGGALHRLGMLCGATGRVDEAVVLLARAVAKDPSSVAAHNDLGVALARQGRPQEALAHYARAAELAPGFAEAHNNLGNVLDPIVRLFDEGLREP